MQYRARKCIHFKKLRLHFDALVSMEMYLFYDLEITFYAESKVENSHFLQLISSNNALIPTLLVLLEALLNSLYH